MLIDHDDKIITMLLMIFIVFLVFVLGGVIFIQLLNNNI